MCPVKLAAIYFLLAISSIEAQTGVLQSRHAPSDFSLTGDPERPEWKGIAGVVAAQDRFGKPLPEARTEIRSRWTKTHLYFLFTSKYETLYLKPDHSTANETWGLWEWDVVEVFIGDDFENINRYKEFEVSPRGEWVDLDIVKGAKPDAQGGWKWNSNFEFKTRIDEQNKLWHCEMRIPWSTVDRRAPKVGNELRLNLYRIEGAPPNRKYITWQAVNSPSFHTPEAFGRLRLVDR